MSVQEIRDTRSVILDANGTGRVTFGPSRPNTEWDIYRVSVKVSSNTDEPQANIYRGSVSPGSLISGTYSGSNDTDSEITDGTLFPGQYYTCEWTGGDVGATATLTFYGQESTRE